MTIYIDSGSRPSKSKVLLGRALGARILISKNHRHIRIPSHSLGINWGSTHPRLIGTILNSANSVSVTSNKLTSFKYLLRSGVLIPEFSVDPGWAETKLKEGTRICVRTVLTGSGGRGLSVIGGGAIPKAALYVQYVPKNDEYRCHVFGDKIFLTQRKARKRGLWDGTNDVRNLSHGWIYAIQQVTPPKIVMDQAIAAVAALGLDFGAVDVGNGKQTVVYEVNTAPGLDGPTTVKAYVEGINYLISKR